MTKKKKTQKNKNEKKSKFMKKEREVLLCSK